MTQFTISVIMPVYNAEKYLDEAIQSILSQTYRDFEFIVINDGSTDKSLEIIEKYKNQDERIVLISRENKGLVESLNEGIKKAKGKYLARMDADDISLPQRFEKQIQLMETEKLDICGCHFFIVDKQCKYLSARVVSCKSDFNNMVLSRSVPFAHGSVMIKKEFLILHKLFYGETIFNKAEDYALWIRFAENNANISNADEFLFKYRHLDDSLSKQSINYKHALALSKHYIRMNYEQLDRVFEKYKNKMNLLNDFELEQFSYFMIKTIFKDKTVEKFRCLKQVPVTIKLINLIRILFGK
ncbi:glycosyltransferase family 2 protein [Sulfurimonas marina]|uniref:Glycosyltransferase n=1 Tax=Sulfurimonas marina TaxID=2590551 RepID=A0A7M1AY23_9BACT|nr:glycosyltransferase [Sulfurimonas marina]QOP41458.1 glycosyltransferase [Sulfurimonas marina]